jgi:Phospholipase_D-nuclease N-terminal
VASRPRIAGESLLSRCRKVREMTADAVNTAGAGDTGAGDTGSETTGATAGLKSAAERWAGLSERQRALLVGAAAAELSLKVAALVDIARRPADRIRGPKVLWRAAMAVNLIGPLSYFLFGRRR